MCLSLCSMLELGIFVSCKHNKSIGFFFMHVMTCSLFVISLIPLTFKNATLSSLAYSYLGALTLVSSSYFTGSFCEYLSFFHCALPQILFSSVPPTFEALLSRWVGRASLHSSFGIVSINVLSNLLLSTFLFPLFNSPRPSFI